SAATMCAGRPRSEKDLVELNLMFAARQPIGARSPRSIGGRSSEQWRQECRAVAIVYRGWSPGHFAAYRIGRKEEKSIARLMGRIGRIWAQGMKSARHFGFRCCTEGMRKVRMAIGFRVGGVAIRRDFGPQRVVRE